MNRYSLLSNNIIKREFLLLQGTGCFHKACRFCHYWDDTSSDPYKVNQPVIARVTGQYGVLDVINSGSVHELDAATLAHLAEVVREKQIHTLWFEAHYHYKDRLNEIRDLFPTATVKFRTGVESFDDAFRRSMNKGMPDVTPEEIRKDFAGVCLLVCVAGQTKTQIEQDIETAARLFEYFSVNVFNPNSTKVRRDPELYDWFKTTIYPKLKPLPNCEVLIENTDLGVG
jgi:histone acetyltransferase (RNA polymerase elongator complex component)